VLTELVLATFQLNGRFLHAAEAMAGPAGLTAAWWQVLGAVVPAPATVAAIARQMGLTRQSVQRIADLLTERGLAEYQPNPQHKRAHLLRPTPAGRAAIAALAGTQHRWANRISAHIGEPDLRHALHTLRRLSEAVASGSSACRGGQGRLDVPLPADRESRK
jgi:DNA-binding MarR family transcriptional regulator